MLIKKYWIDCFLLLLIADTISAAVDWKGGHFFFKSLLMPVLMIGLLHHKRVTAEKNWRLILAGLITAWAGDVLLLFSEDRQQFFMFGLVCFLCTHLAYILYFSRYHRGIFPLYKRPFIAYGNSCFICRFVVAVFMEWPWQLADPCCYLYRFNNDYGVAIICSKKFFTS